MLKCKVCGGDIGRCGGYHVTMPKKEEPAVEAVVEAVEVKAPEVKPRRKKKAEVVEEVKAEEPAAEVVEAPKAEEPVAEVVEEVKAEEPVAEVVEEAKIEESTDQQAE